MELTFANIAMIVAASQSFILSMLIVRKHRALFANRFLALVLLSYTVILVHIIFQDTGVYTEFPVLYLIVGTPLAASQLQYLYTKYLINRLTAFNGMDWLHFLPFALFETGMAASMLFGLADFSDAALAGPETTTFFFRVLNWVLIVLGTAYMGASIRLIVRYNRHLKDVLSSSIDEMQMNWLRNISWAGMSAWILFFIEDLLMTQGINLSDFVLVSVTFAVYVYAMGFIGLTKSEIFSAPGIEETMQQISHIDAPADSEGKKYEKSGLSPDAAVRIKEDLLSLMAAERPYTDPLLTLSQLAGMLSVSPHNLSEVINSQLHKNFYDFINVYRIDQAKKDLADAAKKHLKILSIAFDAGFNSKASFNTLFKQHTGKTPSEFRKGIDQTSGEE